MRQLGLVAVWTLGYIRRSDFPMSAAFAPSGSGVSSFWKWHMSFLYSLSLTIAKFLQTFPAGISLLGSTTAALFIKVDPAVRA